MCQLQQAVTATTFLILPLFFLRYTPTKCRLDVDDAKTILTDIFSSVAQNQSVPNVAIAVPEHNKPFQGFGTHWLRRNLFPTGYEGPEKNMYGFQHLGRPFCPEEKRTFTSHHGDITEAILGAISSSRIELKHLGIQGAPILLQLDRVEQEPLSTNPGAIAVFSNLKTLKIDLRAEINTELLSLLSTCQQLDNLGLMFFRLKKVEFHYAGFDSAVDMTGFLAQHKQSLKELELYKVIIDTASEWSALFRDLPTFPQLQEVSIRAALCGTINWTKEEADMHQERGEAVINCGVMCDQKCEKKTAADYRIRSKEAVKESLEELAATVPVFERFCEKTGEDGSKELVFAPYEETS
ncbi:hypothetical protein BST61_g9458 [Cercospora zeina]